MSSNPGFLVGLGKRLRLAIRKHEDTVLEGFDECAILTR